MISWRGWGPLAFVSAIPVLLAIIGFVESTPKYKLLGSLIAACHVAAWTCAYVGYRWNTRANEHSLYEISLQHWGWIYLIPAAVFSPLALIGAILNLTGIKAQERWITIGIGIVGTFVGLAMYRLF